MPNTIRIPIGDTQNIQALHSKPEEDFSEAKKKLLVVMVHGFPGSKHAHQNIFSDLEAVIGDKGYHCLRFDFRGCGESDGHEENFTLKTAQEDLQCVLSWARDQEYERFIFVGEGLGAAISLLNAPWESRCFVFLWPMLDLPRIAKYRFQTHDIDAACEKEGYMALENHRVGLDLIQDLQKTSLLDTLKDFDKPVMIMHGARDTLSPIQQLDLARMNLKSRRVEITTFHDGTHGLPQTNHRKTMFFHIMQFVEKYT